jgi:hypothetical protein
MGFLSNSLLTTEKLFEDIWSKLDVLQILGLWEYRKQAGDRQEWRHLLREAKAQNGL